MHGVPEGATNTWPAWSELSSSALHEHTASLNRTGRRLSMGTTTTACE